VTRLASVVAASSVLGAPVAATQDFPEVRARGTLRVVVSRDALAEMFSLAHGAPPGLERELVESFAALHKLKIDYVEVPSVRERIPALVEGRGDLIAGALSVTESRKRQVDFTTEVLPLRHVVVTRRPYRVVETLEQLRQERVGTLKGSSWAEEIAAAGVPAANVDDGFPSPEAVIQGLRSGRVTAIVTAIAWAIVEQNKDPDLQLGLFVGPSSGQAWAVRKDQPKLRAALDEYLTNVRRTATWSRLVVKYFGDRAVEALRKSRENP
jgi:membrane-bound lytic murein transglycosylase F